MWDRRRYLSVHGRRDFHVYRWWEHRCETGGKYRILPFLKAKGVSEISYWFVSHTDTDHVSGLKEVLVSGYRVEYLVFAKAVEKKQRQKSWQNWLAAMERKCFICRQGIR